MSLGYQNPLFKDKVKIELLLNYQAFKTQLLQRKLLVKQLTQSGDQKQVQEHLLYERKNLILKKMNFKLLFQKKLSSSQVMLYLEPSLVLMKIINLLILKKLQRTYGKLIQKALKRSQFIIVFTQTYQMLEDVIQMIINYT